MNYTLIYKSLIEKAQLRSDVSGYTEKHHIVPKSLGGSNAKSNLVELTPKEHYIAHMLLYKMHKGTSSELPMLRAWHCMCVNGDRNNRHTSRTYSIAREKYIASMEGRNHPRHNPTIYTFRRNNEVFTGTMVEFYSKYEYYQGRVSALAHQKIKSMDGWILERCNGIEIPKPVYNYFDSSGTNNGNKNTNILHLVHSSGIEFVGMMTEFNEVYKDQKVDLSALYNGRQKTSRGWKIIHIM